MDIDRKLATVRVIAALRPIPGADNIVCATVDGWELVVLKDEFKVGDRCIYFEIDSFLPVRPEYEFLRKSSFKSTAHLGDGFRLRTIKLRKQISQGLAVPYNGTNPVGTDLTEALGVKKWELPENGRGTQGGRRSFPSFLRRTDQERIQNCAAQILAMPPETQFEVTLKLDGSSMTVWHKDGKTGVCSRNLDLIERDRAPWLSVIRRAGEILGFKTSWLDIFEERVDLLKCKILGGRPGLTKQQSVFWDVARKGKLLDILKRAGVNVALQGELMGPGIQGNRENLPSHEFFLFDIWDIDRQRYLSPLARGSFLAAIDPDSSIRHAPGLGFMQVSDFHSVANLLSLASRASLNHPIAEGIVFKAEDGRTSFKAINNAFLLKEVA